MNITICICGGDSGGAKVTPSPKAPQLGRGWCSGPSRGGGAGQEPVVERQGRREEEPGRPLCRGQHFGAGCFCGDLSGWGDRALAAKCIGLP